MNCTTCQSLLVEFVYDELDEETHAAVAAALEDCAECQAELAQLRQTMQVFDNVEALEVPAKLHNDILRSARLAAAEAGPQRSWLASFIASPAFSVAFSGLLLLGGGAAFYQLTYGDEAEFAPAAEMDTVATAVPESEGAAESDELQFADELAASAGPQEEAEEIPTERIEEGRHSLDRAGEMRQAQAEREDSLLRAAEESLGEERELNDGADFDRPVGGAVTGASSSGSMPPTAAAPMQRGGSAREPTVAGNMMPAPAPVPNEPSMPAAPEPEPEPAEEDESYGNEQLALGGSLGGNAGRERERDGRSARAAIRPDSNDAHAPGSAATISEARGGAPSPPMAEAMAPAETDTPGGGASYGARDLAERYEEALPEAEEADRYADDSAADAEEEVAEAEYAVAAAAPSRQQGARGESQNYAEESEGTARSNSSVDDDYMDGVDHYDNGNWGRANRALRRYLEVAAPTDSRRAVARYLLGASYYQEGEYRNAERELRRFLDANPDHQFADAARVLLEDIGASESPTNRRNAPAPVLDSMEAAEP